MRRPPRLRSWVVWCVVVALAWPALGTLPWVAAEDLERAHDATHHSASESVGGALSETHRYYDASDIPGSPAHPADHDCFQCQVFKHWSRCAPSAIAPPQIASVCGSAVRPAIRIESQHAGSIAFLPPVRAPPLRSA